MTLVFHIYIIKHMLKPKHGRTYIEPRGYVLEYRPDHPSCSKSGYVYQHRLRMETHLGRYLTGIEIVHHKNKNPSDNRISNLKLCANHAEHRKLHKPPPRYCHCGQKHYTHGLCKLHYRVWFYKTKQKPAVRCSKCGGPAAPRHIGIRVVCRKCWLLKMALIKPAPCRICGKRQIAKQLCSAHYQQQWRQIKIPKISMSKNHKCSSHEGAHEETHHVCDKSL